MANPQKRQAPNSEWKGPVKRQKPNPFDVANLLPDVLTIIFSYLDVPDKGRASQVCLAWREVINQPLLFREVKATLKPLLNQELLPVLVNRGIRRIELQCDSECIHSNDESLEKDLVVLTLGIPTLRSLDVGCWYTTDKNMSVALLKEMPQLTYLNMTYTKYLTDSCVGRITQKLTNLVTLKLDHGALLTDTALRLIVSGLGALKNLEINSCEHLTDESIKHLAGLDQLIVDKPNLETLSLRGCYGLTNESLFYLSQGQTNLRKLDMGYNHIITEDGLAHLIHFPHLENLCLLGCSYISNRGMIHIAKLANLRTFYSYPISDGGCKFLADGESKIATLDFTHSKRGITDEGVKHLARMTHLTDLRLPAAERVKDVGLSYLAGMHSLRKLSLLMCSITDEGLAQLADGGSKITSLDLNSCGYVTDRGLLHLSRFTQLEELVIAECVSIDPLDVALTNLAGGQVKITKLDVRFLDFTTPNGQRALALLANGLFLLHELVIDRSDIDDEWLKLAAKNLPDLHILETNCKNIIGEVRKFRERSGH